MNHAAILLTAALTGATTDAGAGTESTDELIQRELAAIRAEIETLRSGDRPELEAARAEALRALVTEILDDASARTSLQSDGMTAGYDGKAFLASADGAFKLRLYGFTQVRWTINHRNAEAGEDAWTKGFEIRRTRLFVDGNIERFGYRIRFTAGASGEFRLDQGYIDIPLDDDGLKLRVGQIYLPLFRDDFVSADGQLAADSSVVNQVFNPGNSKAIQLQRAWEDVRFWLAWSDGLRSANTAWNDPANADYAITGRVEFRGGGGDWSRFDTYTSYPGDSIGWMIGVAGHFSGGAMDNLGDEIQVLYVTADATLEGSGWNVSVMGVVAYDDLENQGEFAVDSGILVQGGVFVAPSIELFARYDMLLASDDRANATDPFPAITAGVNWYIAPDSQRLKFTANLIYYPSATSNTLVEALPGSFSGQGLLFSDSGNQWAFQAQVQMQF